jgi:isopentenyldiphosphate isomerase
MTSNTYIGILAFLISYEMLRVQLIRAKLVREEWWTIVNDCGKIIGSIEHTTSLTDEKKYMHPIVRVHLINDGLILLKKRPADDEFFPTMWDAAIYSHVQMGENVDQCVTSSALQQLGIPCFKYLHLNNYTLESKSEIHYAFLFISSLTPENEFLNTKKIDYKWWTPMQIEENLHAGIFSENLVLEYSILKRSGLLDADNCTCRCQLRNVVLKNGEESSVNSVST